MMLADLAAWNAVLCGLSSFFVAAGWMAIRCQRQMTHILCTVAATVSTAAFLAGSAWAAWSSGNGLLHFPRTTVEFIYNALLITHIGSALALPALLLAVYVPVWRQHWNVHRRIGRVAMPVWLYASVTGVLVFLLRRAMAE